MASSGKKKNEPAVTPARAALLDGDFKRARALALAVKAKPDASESEMNDALGIIEATQIDSVPIYVGIGVFCILLVLFGWVMIRARQGF